MPEVKVTGDVKSVGPGVLGKVTTAFVVAFASIGAITVALRDVVFSYFALGTIGAILVLYVIVTFVLQHFFPVHTSTEGQPLVDYLLQRQQRLGAESPGWRSAAASLSRRLPYGSWEPRGYGGSGGWKRSRPAPVTGGDGSHEF